MSDQPKSIQLTARQLFGVAAGTFIAGAAIAGYISGRINYGFGTLNGVECSTTAAADFRENAQVTVRAREYYREDLSACIRATGFPVLRNFTFNAVKL